MPEVSEKNQGTGVAGAKPAPSGKNVNGNGAAKMPASVTVIASGAAAQPGEKEIAGGAKQADSKQQFQKKGFLQSLKDQWEAHVSKNKVKAEKQKAGEAAGKSIQETVEGGEKLTAQEKKEIFEAEKVFQEGLASIRD